MNGYSAMMFPAGRFPATTDRLRAEFGPLELDPDKFQAARSCRTNPVLVCYEHGGSVAHVTALLRHEAEHVCQLVDFPGIDAGWAAAELALATYLDVNIGPSLLYGITPAERDANAAATEFLARLDLAPSREELATTDWWMYRSPFRADRGTLARRLFAFCAVFAEGLEASMSRGGVDSVLRAFCPNGPLQWDEAKRRTADLAQPTRSGLPTNGRIASARAQSPERALVLMTEFCSKIVDAESEALLRINPIL